MFDLRTMCTKNKHCTLYRLNVTDKVTGTVYSQDTQTDEQTWNNMALIIQSRGISRSRNKMSL